MPNYKLDNDLKQLSAYVYRNGKTKKPAGWISIKSEQDKKTGFYAESFYKDGQVAVVYRGSDDAKDAFWLPLNELKQSNMFEDHYSIIVDLLGL